MSYLSIAQTVEVEDVDCLDLSEILALFLRSFPSPLGDATSVLSRIAPYPTAKLKTQGAKGVSTALKVH